MPGSANIPYTTEELARFYGGNRRCWADFYPSEQTIFQKISQGRPLGRVLDVGCAAGGLGLALTEAFGLESYTGVEINPQCAGLAAADLAGKSWFCGVHAADIVACQNLGAFDLVTSLSCADWNVDTSAILTACWDHVAPGGSFVLTLRLTPGRGERRRSLSYQDIIFPDGDKQDAFAAPEQAPYVVLGLAEALAEFAQFTPPPAEIFATGYWGVPSATAHTPFDRLVFTALAVSKPAGAPVATKIRLDWPADALASALESQP